VEECCIFAPVKIIKNMTTIEKMKHLNLFEGIGGLALDFAMDEIEAAVRMESPQRGRQQMRLPKKGVDAARAKVVSLVEENDRLQEELEEAKRGQQRYERVKDFFRKCLFYDVGIKKLLLQLAFAVDDQEWLEELRQSVGMDMRPPNQTMNVYGTNNGMAAMNTTGGNYAFNQGGGATCR
jgi:hypothetical protein